ncbi:MAG: lysophospholipid acyltransferase family protein [Aridibacter sp.]
MNFIDKHKQDFSLAIKDNEKIVFPETESNKDSNKSRVFGKLRYWWCWLAAAMLLLFAALPAMIFLLIINKRLWLYPLCLWGARTWVKACGAEVKVHGLENLEDGRGYIFVSNHRSYLDTATLFGHLGRRIGLVAKKELLKVPVFGQGMGFVNIIAIDRSNPEKARRTMAKAKSIVDAGYSFGVFAEGGRAMPGELLPFKKGAIHLALQTNAPIIPVAIKNTDRLMGKKTGVAYPGTIEVFLLPPIETKGKSAKDDLINLMNESREAIANELASESKKLLK